MAYDAIVASVVAKDLAKQLAGAKIEKVQQPEADEVLFQIHCNTGRKKLLICLAPNGSRVHLTELTYENPVDAPSFCMLLRKHIQGGRISSVNQVEDERIVYFDIETVNEMGYCVNKRLIAETMGKHSNLILIDTNTNKIIDSIKRISIDVNRYRQILPGSLYVEPPKSDSDYVKKIKANICSDLSPVVYLDNGKIKDVHAYHLSNYDSLETKEFKNIHEALDYFYSNKKETNKQMQKADNMSKSVSTLLDKQLLKKQRLLEDIKKANESDVYRMKAELLNANLHLCKPGDKLVKVISYYDGSEVTIVLNEKLSAAKNAQQYYKKYAKLKSSAKEKMIQLETCEKDITYLESVKEMIGLSRTYEELDLIRQELADQGYVRTRTASQRNRKLKPKPRRYILSTGYEVVVGRSNTENDYITFKLGSKTDYWFHTKDIHGSHLILFTNGEEPDAKTIYEAASIAAFFSQGKESENVPVDYVLLRYVKKPNGAKPGMVIFTNNRTVWINPKNPEGE